MFTTPPNRILFIRPSALGDVCRSVPVVASLHSKWPEASIDWLVQTEFVDVVSAIPAIHEVITFPRRSLQRWYLPKGFVKMISFLRLLKSKKYDLVIDGQGLGRSGLFTWATRCNTRIGLASAREIGWIGYTQKVQTDKTHTVDQMLALSEAVGAPIVKDMQLTVTQRDATWWSTFRNENKVQSYVVLAPTSRWESKQWPIERFVEVAKHISAKGMQVVVVGAPSEAQQVEPMLISGEVLNLLPVMTIGRLMAVIESSDCVLANDSAALHMAVGFHRPCIGLFGPTNPARVGPYERDDAVIAAEVEYDEVHYRDRSLGDSLMRQITTEEVLNKVDSLVGDAT
jgi:heptosyltransferase-1